MHVENNNLNFYTNALNIPVYIYINMFVIYRRCSYHVFNSNLNNKINRCVQGANSNSCRRRGVTKLPVFRQYGLHTRIIQIPGT